MGENVRPHIICHMLSSVDGRIECSALAKVEGEDDYDIAVKKLAGDAWLCGRVTMQMHFAEKEPFAPLSNRPAGPRPVHAARKADSYAVAIDTAGKLRWPADNIDGAHLICIVSESVSEEYLDLLRDKGISCIVAGSPKIDLVQAMGSLGKYFGVRRLLLEGGGHINGAFLDAGLVDEVSLLLAPGIDGRQGVPAVFDGISPGKSTAVPLKLKSVEQFASGTLWIRYDVDRS